LSWVNQAIAQLGVGTTWLRTDEAGKGMTLKVEACCNGGLRLIYNIPPMNGQPAAIMTVDSPMDGKETPALIGGKPSGETMAVKRLDDHHFSAVLKMNGQPFGTSTTTVAPDAKSMTVEGVFQGRKVVETWVRQ
jgi:hypothetical protein